MNICKDCMRDEYEIEENSNLPFHSFTIFGGISGFVASILSGPLLLIPVGILAGFGADLVKCQICGNEDDVYQLMSSSEDEGEKIYRPFFLHTGMDDEESFWSQNIEPPEENLYKYDQMEEKLMPVEENGSIKKQEANNLDFDWSIPAVPLSEGSPDGIGYASKNKITSIPAQISNGNANPTSITSSEVGNTSGPSTGEGSASSSSSGGGGE